MPSDVTPRAAQWPAFVTKCTAARGVAGSPCSLAQLAALNLARWSMCAVGSLRPSGCSRLPQVQGGKGGGIVQQHWVIGRNACCFRKASSENQSLCRSCLQLVLQHRGDSPARGSCQPHLLVQDEDVAVSATRWCGPSIGSDGVALVHITTCMQKERSVVLVLLGRYGLCGCNAQHKQKHWHAYAWQHMLRGVSHLGCWQLSSGAIAP